MKIMYNTNEIGRIDHRFDKKTISRGSDTRVARKRPRKPSHAIQRVIRGIVITIDDYATRAFIFSLKVIVLVAVGMWTVSVIKNYN